MKPLQEMTNEELWALFPVMLETYNPEWRKWYAEEEMRIRKALGKDMIVRIGHIGSTAVPGLTAKPTIDILMEVAETTDTERLIRDIAAAGYIYSPQPAKPAPHMMFMKGYTPRGFGERVFHLHVRYPGDWDEFYFRDYLAGHPGAAAEYAGLKEELAAKYRHDRDAYTEAKGDFIRKITALARKEGGR